MSSSSPKLDSEALDETAPRPIRGLPAVDSFLHEIINRASSDATQPSFSRKAKLLLGEKIRSYADQLVATSLVAARGLDSVSAKQVADASGFLSQAEKTDPNELAVALGGVLLGAGLSALVALLLSPRISTIVLIGTVVLCSAGSFLIGRK